MYTTKSHRYILHISTDIYRYPTDILTHLYYCNSLIYNYIIIYNYTQLSNLYLYSPTYTTMNFTSLAIFQRHNFIKVASPSTSLYTTIYMTIFQTLSIPASLYTTRNKYNNLNQLPIYTNLPN